eukprot:2904840-Prymnesium_polylepis.1
MRKKPRTFRPRMLGCSRFRRSACGGVSSTRRCAKSETFDSLRLCVPSTCAHPPRAQCAMRAVFGPERGLAKGAQGSAGGSPHRRTWSSPR